MTNGNTVYIQNIQTFPGTQPDKDINKYQILIRSYKERIEAYNKIVKNEFLAIEDIPNIDDGKQMIRHVCLKRITETREHGGINGLTPSEMFLQRLITSSTHTRTKQKSVTHVGN